MHKKYPNKLLNQIKIQLLIVQNNHIQLSQIEILLIKKLKLNNKHQLYWKIVNKK